MEDKKFLKKAPRSTSTAEWPSFLTRLLRSQEQVNIIGYFSLVLLLLKNSPLEISNVFKDSTSHFYAYWQLQISTEICFWREVDG